MNIIIGGDLVPTESNYELFANGDMERLLGEELLNFWLEHDIKIFNLETPITDHASPIEKTGPNLIAPTQTINGIKRLNPTLVTLANNHIMDQGVQGFNSTLNILNNYDISHLGAGENLKAASRSRTIKKGDAVIGIYTCAENEFSIAGDNTPGANPFDPLESFDHVAALSEKCDFIIVLYHGGKEHYRYPSPYLQRVCRKFVDKGANLVVCQHSHCIGSFEEYSESTIVYGQGNFIFDRFDNEYWNSAILISLSINDDLSVEYNFVPVIKKNETIRLVKNGMKHELLKAFYQRSYNLDNKEFLEQKYKEYAENNIYGYLRKLTGMGKWKSRIDRRLMNNQLLKKHYNKHELLAIINIIECEAHRELLLEGLKNKVFK